MPPRALFAHQPPEHAVQRAGDPARTALAADMRQYLPERPDRQPGLIRRLMRRIARLRRGAAERPPRQRGVKGAATAAPVEG